MRLRKGICLVYRAEDEMKNIFCYEIKKRDEDFRLDVIKNGACDSFFNTSFSEQGENKIKCYADVSGYGPIISYVEMPCKIAISILIALIKAIVAAENRYMLPWNYEISIKTVYTDRRGEKVKMIYVPRETHGRIANISTILKRFCSELENQISAQEKELFSGVMELLSEENKKTEDCLKGLYELQSRLRASLDL